MSNSDVTTSLRSRGLLQAIPSMRAKDGAGVRIRRNIATGPLQAFDPFLMLDEIYSDDPNDYIAGFPEHPHRGFETVTYMLEGRMRHRDHLGNEGLLVPGSVQWMTAGRGVLHSEMPEQESGRMHGFQLWINLPAAEKMCDPNYREFSPDDLPRAAFGNDSEAVVIAGDFILNGERIAGQVQGISTEPDLFDIRLGAGDSLDLPIAAGKQALVYMVEGQAEVGSKSTAKVLPEKNLGLLEDGDQLQLRSKDGARLLLLAARPLNEPIAHWGPFVMNTREELEQAMRDFRSGSFV